MFIHFIVGQISLNIITPLISVCVNGSILSTADHFEQRNKLSSKYVAMFLSSRAHLDKALSQTHIDGSRD